MDQILQLAGAMLILCAFVAAQAGAMDPHSKSYLVMNLIGSLALSVLALHEQQWGFLLLESVWAMVSLWSLTQVLRGRKPSPGH